MIFLIPYPFPWLILGVSQKTGMSPNMVFVSWSISCQRSQTQPSACPNKITKWWFASLREVCWLECAGYLHTESCILSGASMVPEDFLESALWELSLCSGSEVLQSRRSHLPTRKASWCLRVHCKEKKGISSLSVAVDTIITQLRVRYHGCRLSVLLDWAPWLCTLEKERKSKQMFYFTFCILVILVAVWELE